MKNDLKSIEKNKIWDLVEILEDFKIFKCKWIFKIRQDLNGNVERYKARLVSKSFTKKHSIDYKEIFVIVSSKDSLRIIMTLVNHFNLELH